MCRARMYSLTKSYCDKMFGIVSQCFKSEYIVDTPEGYFERLLLKER